MFVGGVVLAYRVDAVLATVIFVPFPWCVLWWYWWAVRSLPLGAIR